MHWVKKPLQLEIDHLFTLFCVFQDTSGQQHQVWYDDESSLIYKYMLAVMSGLKGVGMWTANHLDYSDTPSGKLQREHMWGILP